MKYFTKEWYYTLQRSYMHSQLKPSSRAGSYSEDYFQKLYCQRLKERMEMMRRVQTVDREVLAASLSEETNAEHVNGSPVSAEETAAAAAFARAIAKSLREAPPFSFDPEEVKQTMKAQYLHDLQHYERFLPENIRNKVADLRVLALGHATQEAIDEITRFCNACRETVEAAFMAYRAEFKRNFGENFPAFYEDFDWHDTRIISMEQQGADLTLLFEDCSVCRFRNAEVLQCEDELQSGRWLYDEIYPVYGGGYEIHVLLEGIQKSALNIHLIEFTVRCRDIEIQYAWE